MFHGKNGYFGAKYKRLQFRGARVECGKDDGWTQTGNSGEAIGDILKDFGWGGRAAGGILLHLSPDNERVAAGSFFMRGTEEREFEVMAS